MKLSIKYYGQIRRSSGSDPFDVKKSSISHLSTASLPFLVYRLQSPLMAMTSSGFSLVITLSRSLHIGHDLNFRQQILNPLISHLCTSSSSSGSGCEPVSYWYAPTRHSGTHVHTLYSMARFRR